MEQTERGYRSIAYNFKFYALHSSCYIVTLKYIYLDVRIYLDKYLVKYYPKKVTVVFNAFMPVNMGITIQ